MPALSDPNREGAGTLAGRHQRADPVVIEGGFVGSDQEPHTKFLQAGFDETHPQQGSTQKSASGESGIRTRGRGINLYADLANRCIRPLCHLSKVAAVYQPADGQSMDRWTVSGWSVRALRGRIGDSSRELPPHLGVEQGGAEVV